VGLTFVVGKGRIRVERDPPLCGRLNEEVGHLFVVRPNLGINIMSLVFLSIVFVHIICSLTIPWKNCSYLFGVWILRSALLRSTTLNPVDHLGHPICKVN
jgi:hypothetical protein